MSKKTTLENAIGQVHEFSANHYDEIVPIHEMAFDSLDSMWIGAKPVSVLPSAQRLLSNRLRVPYAYLSRCPRGLAADNLNYWLREEQKQRETFFCRFAGDTIRAVFTERYTVLDHMEVLTKMLENGFDHDSEVHFSLDENIMVLKVPEYNRTFGLSENDKIVPGISIANSEVGILALSIDAFFYRLVCSNGLISKTSVGSRFKHISRRGLDEFHNVLSDVVYQSQSSQRGFQISMETPVDNPMSSIEAFSRQFQLTQNEAEVVKSAWYLEDGATMFHVINAFTRAAKLPGLTAMESYQLERTGGQILGLLKQ